MKPLDITCRVCMADAGADCVWVSAKTRVWNASGSGREMQLFHPERIEDAAAASQDSSAPPSKEEFYRAVEDSELF